VLTDAAGAFTVAVPTGPIAVAAAAAGYYIGCWRESGADCATTGAGASGLTIRLDPLPTDDDPSYVFRDSTTCAACHSDLFAAWDTSTMAHTNRNRWVDNLYNGTDVIMAPGPPPDPQNPPYFAFLNRHNVDARNPARTGECANCHQPEYVGPTPTSTNFNRFSAPDAHGVSCDFCHKIVDVDTSPAGIGRPNLVPGGPPKTTMLRSSSQPWLAFGPLDDVTFPGVPNMRASHACATAVCVPPATRTTPTRAMRTATFAERTMARRHSSPTASGRRARTPWQGCSARTATCHPPAPSVCAP
jgi:hypothetical protein